MRVTEFTKALIEGRRESKVMIASTSASEMKSECCIWQSRGMASSYIEDMHVAIWTVALIERHPSEAL